MKEVDYKIEINMIFTDKVIIIFPLVTASTNCSYTTQNKSIITVFIISLFIIIFSAKCINIYVARTWLLEMPVLVAVATHRVVSEVRGPETGHHLVQPAAEQYRGVEGEYVPLWPGCTSP